MLELRSAVRSRIDPVDAKGTSLLLNDCQSFASNPMVADELEEPLVEGERAIRD